MLETKIISIGNSAGIVLSKEVLARFNLEKGDKLCLIETEKGIELSKYEPDFARQIELGKDIIKKNRDVLKKLAE